jgi:hypothetical protein
MVLESADPDYFIPHVDLTKVAEYTAEAAKAGDFLPSRRLRQSHCETTPGPGLNDFDYDELGGA